VAKLANPSKMSIKTVENDMRRTWRVFSATVEPLVLVKRMNSIAVLIRQSALTSVVGMATTNCCHQSCAMTHVGINHRSLAGFSN